MFLQGIDWNKESKELQGLVMVNGRISSAQSNQKAFAEYLLKKSNWSDAPKGVHHEFDKK
jgi:hypothetical protein